MNDGESASGRPRTGARWRVRGLGWTRAVKWLVVAVLAVWLLHLFISWLTTAAS